MQTKRNVLDLGVLHTSSAGGKAAKKRNLRKRLTLWLRNTMRRFSRKTVSVSYATICISAFYVTIIKAAFRPITCAGTFCADFAQ
jgi:hypothetical protein